MNISRLIKRLQLIRPAKQMSMHVHLRTRGIRWRYCRKHTGVPRSNTSLPKPTDWKAMESDREEAFGYGPTALRPPQCAIPFSHCLPLFYSSRREAVYIALTHIRSLSFRIEIPLDSLPTGFYYLGSDLSPTYLRYTIKCVPTFKGRFSCAKHSSRLGTVFVTTPVSLSPVSTGRLTATSSSAPAFTYNGSPSVPASACNCSS